MAERDLARVPSEGQLSLEEIRRQVASISEKYDIGDAGVEAVSTALHEWRCPVGLNTGIVIIPDEEKGGLFVSSPAPGFEQQY